jgi:hypothetical protein
MEAKFSPAKPDEISMTMTLSMTLGEWKQIREAMGDSRNWPATDLKSKIGDLVRQAEKHFYPKTEPD